MLVLRAFRDAGRVSAGSPPSHPQAERACETGGGRGIRASSFRFPFPFGLSGRRLPKRFGRLGRPESLLEQADWGGVAGAGVRAGGAKTGSRSRSLGEAAQSGRVWGGGIFPRRQGQFRSGRAKKQATKRRTKRDFSSPKRRRFVKTGFTRDIRKRAVPAGRAAEKAPPGQRRPPLSAFALRREEVRAAQSAFALRRAKLPAARPALGRPPRGDRISGSPWLETAAPFRVKVRQIRGPGYPAPKT